MCDKRGTRLSGKTGEVGSVTGRGALPSSVGVAGGTGKRHRVIPVAGVWEPQEKRGGKEEMHSVEGQW